MKKISIKREQSQAGLSFAEREKFRPQVKNKLLLLLALLMTAATGAWAQEQSETIATTDQIVEGTHFTISNDGCYADGDGMTAVDGITVTSKNGETITKVVISCTYGPDDINDGNTSVSSGTKEITNGGGTITVTGVNASTFTFTCSHAGPQFGQFVVYYADAPAGYTVSLKDGVKDADKWTISPNPAEEGQTVTLQYTGRLKVKGVKATSDAAAKPDLLSGVFSVSASKKVNFSKGNLQATYDGSNWTWAFANNQWDYIGNSAGNTKVTDASPFISENGTVDLFGWVGASSTWDGVNQYGITSSKARNVTNGYGNSATENLKKDWGAMMGTGWFTLSKDEWTYLLNTRSASNVGGTDNGRYAKAKVNDVQGIILFPDTYTHPDGVTAPTGVNATGNTGWNGNSYTVADWTKMETAGCVFLPAAGSRDGNSVSYAGTTGTYWWSTHYEGGGDAVDRAYNLYFTNNYLLPTAGSYRDMGCSVRLVQATSEAGAPAGKTVDLSTLTAAYEAQDGDVLKGTLAGNYKISIADGATVTLDGVTINGVSDFNYGWAGITCLGDATIILSGTNNVKGFYEDYPGIQAAADKTLIINGTGSLTASSKGYSAGIGGANNVACGNIEIQGGTITATGGEYGAGIGGAYNASWGNITISGGTVTATGGNGGAGIGGGKRGTASFSCGNIIISGGTVNATGGKNAAGIGGGRGNNKNYLSSCGTIEITTGVTKVTATKGDGATNSIGAGYFGTCGTVTIGGVEGAITTSPYTYDPAAAAEEPVTLATPLTIEAITAGTISVSDPKEGMQYSKNGGAKTTMSESTTIDVAAGDKVAFYGKGTEITSYSSRTKITGSGDGFTCKVYGNIMSLVDEENFATATTLSANYTFNSLFYDFTTLTDASGLLLPATTLAKYCYRQMFQGCTALTTAPELPATQLAAYCYYYMFYGCTALTAAPELPATELAQYCYYQMFRDCSKLATVTCLATSGINQSGSTANWLRDAGSQVQGTKTIYTVSTADWPSGNNGIPSGWTRANVTQN